MTAARARDALRRPAVELRFEPIDVKGRAAAMNGLRSSALQAVCPEAPRIDYGKGTRDAPDAHWELLNSGRLVGRCSLWWSRTPQWNGKRVGFIGHLAAEDRHVPAMLEHACAQLSAQGCQAAAGPVDGSTWRNYRLVTQAGDHPAFFLEPRNPPQWPELFVAAGFSPIATYFSALGRCLEHEDARVARARSRLTASGVCIRPIAAAALDADLLRIYSVARSAFRGNLLYSEPTPEEFIADCRLLAESVPSELVLLAEDAGSPVGFVLAAPDLLQRRRGAAVDTIVIKTLAALPERRYAGLGQWLLSDVQRAAHAMGFRQAIHALVRDAGHLRRISGRSAVPIRRYALFARDLQP